MQQQRKWVSEMAGGFGMYARKFATKDQIMPTESKSKRNNNAVEPNAEHEPQVPQLYTYAVMCTFSSHHRFPPRRLFCNLGMEANQEYTTTTDYNWAADCQHSFQTRYPQNKYEIVIVSHLKDSES